MEKIIESQVPEWVRRLDAILSGENPDEVVPPKKAKKKKSKGESTKRKYPQKRITGRFIFEIDSIT